MKLALTGLHKTDQHFDRLGLPSVKETILRKLKQVEQVVTCEFDLVPGQSFEAVGERGEDAFHSTKHGAESQVEQHEEEEC